MLRQARVRPQRRRLCALVLGDLGIDAKSDSLHARCLERAHACSALDDECDFVLVTGDQGRNAVERCLSLECAQLMPCLLDPVGH
jgi:hypothetical protein